MATKNNIPAPEQELPKQDASNQQEDAGQTAPAPKEEAPQPEPDQSGPASLRAIGNEVLDRNPNLKVVFVTADGYAFPVEGDAVNYAARLRNKKVVTVKRK